MRLLGVGLVVVVVSSAKGVGGCEADVVGILREPRAEIRAIDGADHDHVLDAETMGGAKTLAQPSRRRPCRSPRQCGFGGAPLNLPEDG
jgi:hypothetical protein